MTGFYLVQRRSPPPRDKVAIPVLDLPVTNSYKISFKLITSLLTSTTENIENEDDSVLLRCKKDEKSGRREVHNLPLSLETLTIPTKMVIAKVPEH